MFSVRIKLILKIRNKIWIFIFRPHCLKTALKIFLELTLPASMFLCLSAQNDRVSGRTINPHFHHHYLRLLYCQLDVLNCLQIVFPSRNFSSHKLAHNKEPPEIRNRIKMTTSSLWLTIETEKYSRSKSAGQKCEYNYNSRKLFSHFSRIPFFCLHVSDSCGNYVLRTENFFKGEISRGGQFKIVEAKSW